MLIINFFNYFEFITRKIVEISKEMDKNNKDIFILRLILI